MSKRKLLDDDQIIQALTGLKVKLDNQQGQIMNLGLFTEYLYTRLEAEGVDMKMEDFQEWAESRFQEIQEEADKIQQQQLAGLQQAAANNVELNLEDD